jgi:hypothetical protein
MQPVGAINLAAFEGDLVARAETREDEACTGFDRLELRRLLVGGRFAARSRWLSCEPVTITS